MKGILTGNQLKILALITMTMDHLGAGLFPELTILRMVGRLAFPIFAYMIAEGCIYTKNRKKYFGLMSGLAISCQLVYFFTEGSLYQCILVTFSLSIGLIYLVDYILEKRSGIGMMLLCVFLMGIFFLTEVLPEKLPDTNFKIDYGFWGVLVPVFIYLSKTRRGKLTMTAIGLVLVALSFGGIQWYSLISLVFLALYNGKRGKRNMKYLFYVYYPLHLVLIYFISEIII